ncbi:EpsG family protein [Odoribacter laneus]|uniref:EpsG family protein n=1 Tax=Odoribacter laneus YIT 12061 TaxID=742817 RepID=H1DLG2_9BACT|nr:EpsG family protein [Odoribacter laneus]EHP44948.1 hypothetical protein HMPREF9449_03098 [Odoribacter laneus YIT 12061]
MIILDLVPYILFLIISQLIGILQRKQAIIILILLFGIFLGFRYMVGWDFMNYYRTIINAGWELERFEFIPQQLGLLAHKAGNPQIFIFIMGFATILFFFTTLYKRSTDLRFSLFAFTCLPVFFIDSFTTIRFTLAVGICFFAYYYFNDNLKKSLLLILLATFVHRAAFFGFLIPLIRNFKINLFTNILLFIISIIIGISGIEKLVYTIFNTSLIPFVSESTYNHMAGYITDANASGFSKSRYIYTIFNLINFIFYRKIIENNNEIKKNIFLYNIGCCCLYIFSFSSTLAPRLSTFFLTSILLIVPFYKRIPLIKIFVYLLLFAVFVYQLSIIGYHPDFATRRNCFVPYQFYFFQ